MLNAPARKRAPASAPDTLPSPSEQLIPHILGVRQHGRYKLALLILQLSRGWLRHLHIGRAKPTWPATLLQQGRRIPTHEPHYRRQNQKPDPAARNRQPTPAAPILHIAAESLPPLHRMLISSTPTLPPHPALFKQRHPHPPWCTHRTDLLHCRLFPGRDLAGTGEWERQWANPRTIAAAPRAGHPGANPLNHGAILPQLRS